ncbi:MAG TPA: hypothetical protein VMP01_30015 [Pirellulaceae bacterium]|nr:hypothetical protein [Pirellulaceae bacterium]
MAKRKGETVLAVIDMCILSRTSVFGPMVTDRSKRKGRIEMQADLARPVVLFLFAFGMTARGQDADYPIIPHPETQELIAKWATPFANDAQLDEHYALLGRLMRAADDSQRFVQQVVYFVHHQEKSKDGGLRGMMAMTLLDHCDVSVGHVAIALVPYLYGEHAALRKSAWGLFLYGQRGNYPPGYTDLSYVADAARSDKEEIATPVRRAIFEVAPNAAFHLFWVEADAGEFAKLLRAQRTLENALFEQKVRTELEPAQPPWKLDENTIEALRVLSASKYWWARMFASEFMFRHEDFRIPELIEKLEQDEDDLVRNSAVSITTPDPLRSSKVLLMPLKY